MTTETGGSDDRALALIEAARRGTADEVRTAIPGTDLDCRNDAGETALVVAAQLSRPDICRMLIGAGADPALGSTAGDPISYFAMNGWIDLLAIALDREADPFAQKGKTPSAFKAAAYYGEAEALELIASRAKWNLATKSDELAHALYAAASSEIVDVLVTHGADVNRPAKNDEPPLLRAARAGDAKVCRRLIDYGADINYRVGGKTALYYAALYDKPDAMTTLLDAGAEQQNISDSGQDLAEVVLVGGRDVTVRFETWRARAAMIEVAEAARRTRRTPGR